MAEGVGFEPTEVLPSTVFKTAAFDHSAIPPLYITWTLHKKVPDSCKIQVSNLYNYHSTHIWSIFLSLHYVLTGFIFYGFEGVIGVVKKRSGIQTFFDNPLCRTSVFRNIIMENGINAFAINFVFAGKGIKMKQKYTIVRDDKNKQLIIREFAELDKQILSLLCEETYDSKAIRAAIKSGRENLISALRTNNLYPPGIYAEKIADAVKVLYATKGQESTDLFFDDLELLAIESGPVPQKDDIEEEVEKQGEDMDELLEDDFESDYEDKDKLNKLDSSLKIADDDFGNGPDDS